MNKMYVEGFVDGWQASESGTPLEIPEVAAPASRSSYEEGYIDGHEAQGSCGSSHPIDELNFRNYCSANGL